MSFLFKSKKHQTSNTLPPVTRNIHTSDGTTSALGTNGVREKDGERLTQSPAPGANPTNSLSSLTGATNSPDHQWQRQRERADSDSPARRGNVNGAVPNAALYPWSQRRLAFPTPQPNPFPRYGAAVNAVASKEGDIYMMGGLIKGSMVKGDLWMVESGSGNFSCSSVATVSEGPGPRVGHASLLVGNAFIVFGGDTKMDDLDALDDTLYLLNTSSRQWSRATPNGPKPAGRYGHTLNIIGSKIYIFGGQVEGYFFNDLLAFDLNALQLPANQWEFLIRSSGDGGPAPGQLPPARTNHSVISYQDQLYLFGGTNGMQWFNDVWSYEPRTNVWTLQECIGYIPAPREGHSAAVVGDVMYIFGGRTEEGTDLGDLAAFRLSTRRWYTFQNMGPSPSPRSGHSMTAHGKLIIVLAGEPSSAPRDPGELSMVYVLDTAKIRYPNNDQPPAYKAEQGPPGVNGKLSIDAKNAIQAGRSVSRDGQLPHAGHMQKDESSSRDNPVPAPGQTNKNSDRPIPTTQFGPQPVRAAVTQAPVGPPPQGQAPDPRTNNAMMKPSQPDSQNRTPPKEGRGYGPSVDTHRAVSAEGHRRTPSNRESPKDLAAKIAGQASPEGMGRRTPTQQPAIKAKAMEAGEAAPLISGPSRQRSLRSQRGHSSIDSSDEAILHRSASGRIHSGDAMADVRSLRSLGDEPKSPRLTAHQEALIKELEAAKSRNAWYASELALARKAGFHGSGSSSPMFDERAVNQLGDEDRPLIEAFLAMRAELGKMQQTVEQQAAAAAKQVAEVEHQRDAAVSEAAYARAKLAAHSGSAHGTPQPDSARDIDDGAERTTDISRRLALALAAQHEHKSKLELTTNELQAEKRAREFAEESAEAAQKRLDEMSRGRNPMELETLRAELHEAQVRAREEAAERARAEEKLDMSQVDRDEISQKHEEKSNRLQEHIASLGALQAAVSASSERASTLERHVEQEREQKESLEQKLVKLRAEHEERTTELESTARRLRETEELADTHAKEAATHREALVLGLSRATQLDSAPAKDGAMEQRILTLQQSADRAHSLAKNNREAADLAAQKLRSAEERIAGLEAYQEQSSREGLQIRRQMQAALKEVQTAQAENRELKAQLENHQRDANALAIQHGALKNVLSERSLHHSDARRSPLSERHSPTSRLGSPDQNRLRELEQQLQSSMKVLEETKSAYESREQDADRRYREKLEQLENDYQSAVHYVKRTEKMLKWMNDELSKYKTQNSRMQAELEGGKGGGAGGERSGSASQTDEEAVAAKLASERAAGLQKSLDELQKHSGLQIGKLESQLSALYAELAAARAECEQYRIEQAALSGAVQQSRSEMGRLQVENQVLEGRALDAEQKVTMLLDQVGRSVGDYRRRSELGLGGGGGSALFNNNNNSNSNNNNSVNGHYDLHPTTGGGGGGGGGGRDGADSSSQDSGMFADNRGSMALDSLASELDALKSRWESTSRSYRLSNQFDFEKTATGTTTKEGGGAELSENLANWRKRLEDEERVATTSSGGGGKSGGGGIGVGGGGGGGIGIGGGMREPVSGRDGDMI